MKYLQFFLILLLFINSCSEEKKKQNVSNDNFINQHKFESVSLKLYPALMPNSIIIFDVGKNEISLKNIEDKNSEDIKYINSTGYPNSTYLEIKDITKVHAIDSTLNLLNENDLKNLSDYDMTDGISVKAKFILKDSSVIQVKWDNNFTLNQAKLINILLTELKHSINNKETILYIDNITKTVNGISQYNVHKQKALNNK